MILSQILTIILFSCFTLLAVVFLFSKIKALFITGVIIISITVFWGWVLFGFTIPFRTSYDKVIPSKVIKSDNAVYISYNKKDYSFKDISTYNKVNDTTKCYIKHFFNLYNQESGSKLVIDTLN